MTRGSLPRPGAASDVARLIQQGGELYQAGQFGRAEKVLTDVMGLDPVNANALYILALIAFRRQNTARGLKLVSQALELRPDIAAMYNSRAAMQASLGRFDQAIEDLDQAIARTPDVAGYHVTRADLLGKVQRPDEAVEGYRKALTLQSDAETHNRLGAALHAALRSDEAVTAYEAAVAMGPDNATAHMGLGNALYALGQFERAFSCFETAVRLEPANANGHYNLGSACRVLGRSDQALASFDAAIALKPDFAVAHHNRAIMLLQIGELAAGFEAFEWRKKCPGFDDPRYGQRRQWLKSEPLAGKTLFVYPEYFKGDLIQFCRYVRLAEEKGAHVIMAAPASMHRLLRTLSPTLELVPLDAAPRNFDYQTALLSLPHAFRGSLDHIPSADAYLQAEPQRIETWRARIGESGFRIGIAWQGSTLPYSTPLQRSFPLAAFQDIARMAGVRLISLQKHEGVDQLSSLPAGMRVETLGDDFDTGEAAFLDTAAAMACCDLVITLDTSIAHLAGALGVRTWVALPFIADWRWLAERSDSPWYPSMRLFRQCARNDWDGVFADMKAALEAERSGA